MYNPLLYLHAYVRVHMYVCVHMYVSSELFSQFMHKTLSKRMSMSVNFISIKIIMKENKINKQQQLHY